VTRILGMGFRPEALKLQALLPDINTASDSDTCYHIDSRVLHPSTWRQGECLQRGRNDFHSSLLIL